MSEWIWKVKSLLRKLKPLVICGGIGFFALTAYQKGWVGRRTTQQISSWTQSLSRRLPVFGSRLLSKPVAFLTGGQRSSFAPAHSGSSRSRVRSVKHRRRHSARLSRHRRHRRH